MKKSLFYTIAGLLFSTQVFAGGYQLSEYSVTNLGRSFGGAGIVGDDYSAIAFNPAGMSYKKTGIQVGAMYVDIAAKAHGQLSDGDYHVGKMHAHKVLPHFFAQKQINDKLTIGAGVYVPFGLGTYYDKDWFGQTHAVNSEINVIDVAAAASYKLTDTLSVGASIYAERMDARLTNSLPYGGHIIGTSDLNADDWSKGYNVGIAFEPVKNTRFGLTYRSKSIHNIKGPHYLHINGTKLQGDCGTKLVLPEHILISAYQKVGDFGLSAMARWTRWSHFNTLTIHSDARTGERKNLDPVREDWRNVWMFGVGSDYYLNDNWTLRAGLAYDQGAVKRAEHRTARVPDSNRWIASIGASYKVNNWQIDFSYAHMFLRNAHVNNWNKSANTTLDAKYNMGINLVGMAFQYNF